MSNTVFKEERLRTVWQKAGRYAAEHHKDILLEKILQERVCADNLTINRWMTNEVNNVLYRTLSLVSSIKNLRNDIVVYGRYNDRKLNSLFITSNNYDESLFDSITDLIIEYELITGQRLEFYYTEEKNLLRVPSGASEL